MDKQNDWQAVIEGRPPHPPLSPAFLLIRIVGMSNRFKWAVLLLALVLGGIALLQVVIYLQPIKPLTTFQAHPEPIEAIHFSADGQVVSTVPNITLLSPSRWSRGGATQVRAQRGVEGATAVKQWQLETAALTQGFSDPLGLSDDLVFAPAAKILASQAKVGSLSLRQRNAQGTDLDSFTLDRLRSGYGFSRDGRKVAVVRYDLEQQRWAVEIWDMVTREQVQQIQHLSIATEVDPQVEFSPDGTQVAVLQNRVLSLWNIDSGQLVGEPFESVEQFGFSQDSTWLWLGRGTTIERWNLATNQAAPLIQLGCSVGQPALWAIAGDGRRLACFEGPDGLAIYNLETGRSTAQVSDIDRGRMALHPQGELLALYQESNQQIQIRHGVSGEMLTQIDLGQSPGSLRDIRFSDDGQVLLGDRRRYPPPSSISVWDPSTGEEIGTLPDLSDRIESQDEAAITTQPYFALQPEIMLWDTTSGRLLSQLNQADLHLIGFDPSETYLFTHSGARLQQWNVSTGELQQTLTLQRGSISLTALAARSSTLAAASSSVVQVWNLDTGATLQTVEIDSPGQLRAMALSPDGNVLALDQSDRLRLINVNTGRVIASVSLSSPLAVRRRFNQMQWPAGAIAFSADGQGLALRNGREIWILRGSNGRRIRQIKLEPENSGRAVPRSLAFSPDGRRLAMGDYEGNLQLWQLPRRLSLF